MFFGLSLFFNKSKKFWTCLVERKGFIYLTGKEMFSQHKAFKSSEDKDDRSCWLSLTETMWALFFFFTTAHYFHPKVSAEAPRRQVQL